MKTGKLNRWLILAAAALILAAAVVGVVLFRPGPPAPPEAVYTEVEGAIGTVRFAQRTTTAEEYEPLWAVCDDCRETAGQTSGAAVNTAVVVSEDTFVDTGEAEEETSPEPDVYVESEAVYFEGLVLIRYASQFGDHLTLAACYDEDGLPMILSMDGLALEGFSVPAQQPQESVEDGILDEETFLSGVKGSVIALLSGEADSDAIALCFTENGAAALRRVGQSAGVDEGSGAEVLLCGIGSTSSSEMLADRIVVRCRVTAGGEPVVLDLLLKLNSELLIFDVDLI